MDVESNAESLSAPTRYQKRDLHSPPPLPDPDRTNRRHSGYINWKFTNKSCDPRIEMSVLSERAVPANKFANTYRHRRPEWGSFADETRNGKES